jgi:hypothetical protein
MCSLASSVAALAGRTAAFGHEQTIDLVDCRIWLEPHAAVTWQAESPNLRRRGLPPR